MKNKEQIARLEQQSKMKTAELEGNLTPKELRYWRIVKANSGVLFLQGAPGTSKSAIAKSIATKLNLEFWDLRLSQMDAVDLGCYPYPLKTEEGEPFLTQLNPDWMLRATHNNLENNNGWLIFYDELNRAPLEVRNAALRILLERTSNNLEFPKHVYQMAAGNLGSEDGTQVEELDGALRSRLIKMNHTITLPEWREGFADANVHPYIVRFLEAKPGSFTSSDVDADVIANARTWTFLSDYIIENFGWESGPQEWLSDMNEVARAYIGTEALKFIKWCEDNLKLTLSEVLKASAQSLPAKLKKATKLQLTELINDLKAKDFEKFTDKEYKNAVTLIKANQDETIVEFISHIGQSIDQNIITDRSTRYNDLLRIKLAKWKDMVMEKAD